MGPDLVVGENRFNNVTGGLTQRDEDRNKEISAKSCFFGTTGKILSSNVNRRVLEDYGGKTSLIFGFRNVTGCSGSIYTG